MKTIKEIKERIECAADDVLGFEREALAIFVPEFYVPEHKHECPPLTEDAVIKEIREYMTFAFEKAIDHRGISASRSIIKMTAWLWVLDDHELEAFARDERNYTNYGVPILKRIAHKYDIPIPEEIKAWSDGKPCRPGCSEGCGR